MAEPGTAAPIEETPSEEILLLERLRAMRASRVGAYVVHLHLSELRPGNRKPHFIRIAARSFEMLITNFDVVMFQLANTDFVLLCREVPVDDVDASISKARALFSEDPLTAGDVMEDQFSTWHDISQDGDYTAFMTVAADLLEDQQKRQLADDAMSGRTMEGNPLTPANVSAINRRLHATPIEDLIREQTAVQVHVGGKGKVLFRENYISMFDLQKRIAPDINLFGSTWLFQYLTETIDKRLLLAIQKVDFDAMDDAISLNLNIGTVLAREFQQFTRVVGDNASKVVIEVQLINIFADLGAFIYARDSLQERGFRVLIDGLNPLSLQFFEPGLLAADFVKIGWGREFLGEVQDTRLGEMRDVVEHTGSDRVILARVDSEDAVKWGLNLGITRYQGHYIDTVVEAMTAKGII